MRWRWGDFDLLMARPAHAFMADDFLLSATQAPVVAAALSFSESAFANNPLAYAANPAPADARGGFPDQALSAAVAQVPAFVPALEHATQNPVADTADTATDFALRVADPFIEYLF